MKLEAAIDLLTDAVKSEEWAYGPAVKSVLDALAAERQLADDWKQVVDLRDSEIADLKDKLATPVSLPKAAYFNNSAENLPFFRAFSVIEAIHKVGFLTVTYED